MVRIGAGMTGVDVTAQKQIRQAFDRLTESSVKMATLKKINRASDDPAGMIAAEQLSRELRAVEEASRSTERTRSVVHVADSGMSQASKLLNDIRGNLVTASSDGTSSAEKEALQMEIDAAIDALDRIGYTTSFGDKKPLRGEALEFLAGTEPSQTETLELPEVSSGSLGSSEGKLYELRSGGSASLDGDLAAAAAIVDGARSTLVSGRAEAGAFERYVVDTTQGLLDDVSVNLSQSLSQVLDTDLAAESAKFVQAKILADTAVVSAKFTNSARQAAAGLLNDVLDVFG